MNRDCEMGWNMPGDSHNRDTSRLKQQQLQRGGSNHAQGHPNWVASPSHRYEGSNRSNNAQGYPNWGASPSHRYEGNNAQGYPNCGASPSHRYEGSNRSSNAQGHPNWGASLSNRYEGSNRSSNAQGYPNCGSSPQQRRESQSVQLQPTDWSMSRQQPHHSNRHVPQNYGNHRLNLDEWTPNTSWISWTSSHVVRDDGFGPRLLTQWQPKSLF